MVFAKEATNDRRPRLYYLIYQKDGTHAKDTWEPIKEFFCLWQLLKKYYSKNLNKPIVTFLPINKNTPSALIVAYSEVENVFLYLHSSHIYKYFYAHKNPLIQFYYSK